MKRINGILLYILFLCILPFGELLRIDVSQGVVLHIRDIAVGLIVLIFIFSNNLKKLRFEFVKYPLWKPIILFVSLASISLLVNILSFPFSEIFIASFYLLRWISYSIIYFIIMSFSLKEKKKIFFCLLVSSFTIIILGFIQYIFYPDLRNLYYLGWDEHLYRMFSTYLDPNFLAVIINLFIFAITTLLISFWSHKKYRLLFLFNLCIGFVALLLTYSRGGYIMFLVGIFVLLWMTQYKRFTFYIFFIFIIGIVLIPKNLRSAGVELWRTDSIQARLISARNALLIAKDHPVFGVGFNTYSYAQEQYGYISKKKNIMDHSSAGTDNSLLFVLVTTGIVGVLAYIYLQFTYIKNVYSYYKKSEKNSIHHRLSIISLSFFIGIISSSIFINSLFYPTNMLYLWTLLGLVGSQISKEDPS